MMKTIINDSESFPKIAKFLKKYFDNVKVVKNENSHLANLSQNFWITILFENRGTPFSIKWNYYHSTIYFGDITKNNKTCLQYSFTKMRFDNCYPIEEMNNNNIVFWSYEITNPHDDIGFEINPLRLPISKKHTK